MDILYILYIHTFIYSKHRSCKSKHWNVFKKLFWYFHIPVALRKDGSRGQFSPHVKFLSCSVGLNAALTVKTLDVVLVDKRVPSTVTEYATGSTLSFTLTFISMMEVNLWSSKYFHSMRDSIQTTFCPLSFDKTRGKLLKE